MFRHQLQKSFKERMRIMDTVDVHELEAIYQARENLVEKYRELNFLWVKCNPPEQVKRFQEALSIYLPV